MKEKKTMEATIENYESLEKSLSDIGEMIELTEMEEASGASSEELAEMAAGIEADYADFEKKLEDLRLKTLLTGKYDHCGAILSISQVPAASMRWTGHPCCSNVHALVRKAYHVKILDLQGS